jgi:hypothetical protein
MATNEKNARYVRPSSEGGWDVIGEGHRRASAHAATESEAIQRAREIVKQAGGGEVRVMNKYGKLVDRNSVSGSKLRNLARASLIGRR